MVSQSKTESLPAKIVSFGELLIDFVPTVNGVSLADAPAFKKAPGGAPANVAVGCARLGIPSAFVGKVGDDPFGHMLADVLRENGVNTAGMRFDKGARTALAFVTLREDGEREFMFYRHPSADMLLTPDELDDKLIRQAEIFHYGSISLISEPVRTAHIAALEIARQAGAFLSYDPNLRLALWPSAEEARQGIMSIWSQANLIKISEEELTFLAGADTHACAQDLLYDDLHLLLVTEGKNGCRYYTRQFHGRVDSFQVAAIDATGAGDAFTAAFLTQLVGQLEIIQNESALREALRFANAAGAITTTERGAIPALPDHTAVEKLLNRQ